MTISTELRKAGPFTGNGVTTAFPFSFKVFAASDVAVTRADTLGAETALVLNSDFAVTLNPDQDVAPGGTVTLAAPLATGYRLAVTSVVPNLQPTDITSNGGFYPRVIEDALDRHVAQIQQINEKVDRALRVAITSPLGDKALPSPIAGMLIGWNEGNDGLKNYAPIGGTLLGQQLAEADGSSLVGFRQNGAGAVLRTLQDKAREQVSVMDFGAAGDGVSDDTAAIQAAIDFAAPKGLEIHVPAGAFLVSSPLVYETEGFSPGLRISGAGMQRTTIVANFIAPDMSPVLDISGAEKAPYLYQLGGLIRGITFTKKNEATNVAGIRLLGCWYLTIEDVRVFNLDGDGIYTELRDDLSNDWGEPNNPDGYSVIGLRLNNCLMESVRYGIVQGSGIGSSQWHIFQTRVAGARLGGIVVAGYNCKIEKCGFGLNSLQAPEGEGFNVKITRVVSAAPTGVTISDTEFDASKDNHIIIDRTSGLTLKNNRFITSDRFGISVPTPKVHILAQSINREMVSYGCMHRIDDNFGAVTLYSGSSSCENCEISGVRIENNGNPYVGVTGFPADRGNRVSLGSTLLRYGNRKPTVIAGFSSSALTAGVNIGGSSAALSFDSLLNNGGIYSVNSSYDPLTGVFTAPLDGCYIFDVFICITISADATVNLILSKNGSGAASSSGFSRSGFRTTFSLRAAIELKSGDAIRVLASQSHGGNVALHNDRNTHGFSVFLA